MIAVVIARPLAAHPGIDFVLDPVAVGRAHQDRGSGGCRAGGRVGIGVGHEGNISCGCPAATGEVVSRAANSSTSTRRKGSTSVTRPTVWNEPRSRAWYGGDAAREAILFSRGTPL